MTRAWSRTLRTLVQLAASGSLTALVTVAVSGLSSFQTALVLAVNQVLVTLAQNTLEQRGTIPTLLPPTS